MGKLGTFLVFLCVHAGVMSIHGQTAGGPAVDPQRVAYSVNGKETELYKDNSYALVIGNSKYTKWPALPGVEEDVRAVSEALKSHGFVVETAADLTSNALKARVDKFIDDYGFGTDRRIVIYFAGHGATRRTSDGRKLGYIIPLDSPRFTQDEKAFLRLAISMDVVDQWARRIEANHALFAFDSCFAGNLLTRSDLNIPLSIQGYIGKPVRQYITSGDENQEVSDNSPFRRYFVEGLEGKADSNADGYIIGSELAMYLRDNVINRTQGKQTPLHGKINDLKLDRGEIIFSVPLQARLENDQKADEAWARTLKNDPDQLENFARTFPGSRHRSEALERIAILTRGNTAPRRSDGPGSAVEPTRRAPETFNFDFQTATYDAQGVITKSKKATNGFREELAGGLRIDMVKIPAGKFRMGSNADTEKPIREVSVDEFHMSATEITQAQWRAIAKTRKVNIDLYVDPSTHTGEDFPVESITWEQAKEFCARLRRETGRDYDLPSEAEWEYAARAGSVTNRPFGEKINSEVANYDALPRGDAFAKYSLPGPRRNETVAAGSLKIANAFGLYDMLGNVAEWCLDSWQFDYKGASTTAASRETNTRKRVVRGGSYDTLPSELTVTQRKGQNQDESFAMTGFRIVLRTASPK